MINDEMKTAETVSAILKNALTGEETVIDGNSVPKSEPTYKYEIKITNLKTGDVRTIEAKR
jgi:hypothetical protein